MNAKPIAVAPLIPINKTYRWYAIYCRSRQEGIIEQDLFDDGFEVYLPKLKKLRVWSDRKKWVEMPLFPSYCFVRVSNVEYYKVLEHYAVVKYVSIAGVAVPIRDQHIEAVKRALGENLDISVTTDRFKSGQRVEIGVGPMMGCFGEIVKLSGKKKLIIRLDEIGYSLLVTVPAAYIEEKLVV